MLHWGVRSLQGCWRAPNEIEERFPVGAVFKAPGACRSPFYSKAGSEDLTASFRISTSYLISNPNFRAIPFVLYDDQHKKYYKKADGQDFLISINKDELKSVLYPPVPSANHILNSIITEELPSTTRIEENESSKKHGWYLASNNHDESRLTAYRYSTDSDLWVVFLLNSTERYLIHWGLTDEKKTGWKDISSYADSFDSPFSLPFSVSSSIKKDLGKSWNFDAKSRRTSFVQIPQNLAEGFSFYQVAIVRIPGSIIPVLSGMTSNSLLNLSFVLKSQDSDKWIQSNGQDFYLGPLVCRESFDLLAEEALNAIRAKQKEQEVEVLRKAIQAKEFNYVLETFNQQRSQRRRPFDELKMQLERSNKVESNISSRKDSKLFLLRSASLAIERPEGRQTYSVRPLSYKTFTLSDGEGQIDVLISARLKKKACEPISEDTECQIQVEFLGCLRQSASLHWGVQVCSAADVNKRQRPADWTCPSLCYPLEVLPKATVQIDSLAAQTPLQDSSSLSYPRRYAHPKLDEGSSESSTPTAADGGNIGRESLIHSSIPLRVCTLYLPAEVVNVEDDEGGDSVLSVQPKPVTMADGQIVHPWAISMVIKGSNGKWSTKEGGGNIIMTLRSPKSMISWKGPNRDVAESCIEAETLWSHMTLMHRANLFNELVSSWEQNRTKTSSFKSMCKRKSFSRSSSMVIDQESEIQSANQIDCDFWSWFVVWGRMSQVRLLDWQRNYNTKPRDLAGATQALTTKLASVWSQFSNSPIRSWVRLFMMTLPRGGDGGTGQAIRDEILHILHRHNIPETNNHFYEQWHQKLHNNTTPDDIPICKAVIAFLRSGGDHNTYLRVLDEEGLSLERMASYDRKITHLPYMPHCDTSHLIADFENYLSILKNVHDALDISASFSYASAHMNEGQRGVCWRAMGLLKAHCHPSELGYALAEARRAIHKALKGQKDGSAVRDLLLLDCSFETQQVIAAHNLGSRESYSSIPLNETRSALNLIVQLLEGATIHYPTETEVKYIISDMNYVSDSALRWWDHPEIFKGESDAALLVLSVLERASRWLASISSEFTSFVLPKIEFLAENILDDREGKNHPEIPNFLDELLRGTFLSAVSGAIQKVDLACRNAAKMGSFQILSRPHVLLFNARIMRMKSLQGLQDHVYPEPTVMVCDYVDGSEDIPEGVVGIVAIDSAMAPDMLSHVAVRARNCQVMMVVVHDDKEKKNILTYDGQRVSVEFKNSGALLFGPPNENYEAKKEHDTSNVNTKAKVATLASLLELLPSVSQCSPITTDKFSTELVGAKSFNLERLKKDLSRLEGKPGCELISLPDGLAYPFGAMQAAIQSCQIPTGLHTTLSTMLSKVRTSDTTEKASGTLRETAELIEAMKLTPQIEKDLEKAIEILFSECSSPTSVHSRDIDVEEYWMALKACWASIFNPRPWSAILKSPLDFSELQMCVLIQKVYPACMSFVLHTRDPCDDPENLVGEMVYGLGEVLVGNEPGSACTWTVPRASTCTDSIVLRSFPSKSSALITEESNVIFRSDSNSEDREGFAGAGLFESVPALPFVRRYINYSHPNANDFPFARDFLLKRAYRDALLRSISDVGLAIESVFGRPMDIEGVIFPSGDSYRIGIVQARPQV